MICIEMEDIALVWSKFPMMLRVHELFDGITVDREAHIAFCLDAEAVTIGIGELKFAQLSRPPID